MCGITGIFDTRHRREIDLGVLRRMNESQHHRGPDEGSVHVEAGWGSAIVGSRFIDIATGQQPICNEDGSVVLIYNGEIYNYRELIPRLLALGPLSSARRAIPRSSFTPGKRGGRLREALPRHVRVRALGP
jgi:asparagine synthase (glutamine-hydrolysing)